ncbi:MAG: lipopolysaccharide biosynthesis protein [Actinomycetes bacterium]
MSDERPQDAEKGNAGGGAVLERGLLPGTARDKARTGLGWTLMGQWSGYLLQILTMIALARLLTPADFGLVGMALALTAFVDRFRGLGLSQAVVQHDALTLNHVNGLFWVNALAGVVFAAVVSAVGPLLVAFFGRDELLGITAALSTMYVFSALAVQHTALLSRRMEFRKLALRPVFAQVPATLLAVAAAVLGAGYWSLVILYVSLTLFSLLFVWSAVPWRPGWPRDMRATLPLVRFGAGITIADLLNALGSNADKVLIGKFLGAAPLGFYSRAYGLLMLPMRQLRAPVGGVLLPMLASLRNEPERFRRLYCGALSGLTHLGAPVVAVLAITAEQLVVVTLGPHWREAGRVFQLLAVVGLLQLSATTCGWLFTTSGRSRQYARWALVTTMVTVASFVVGLRWGINGVAASFVASALLLTWPSFALAVIGTPVRLKDIVGAVWRPLVVALGVAAAARAALVMTAGQADVVELAAGVVGGGLAWGLLMVTWRRARAEVAEILGLFLQSRAGRRIRRV